MAVEIIIEIILGLILAGVSSAFWNCIKSPKFLAKTLSDSGYQELKKFYHHLGKEKIQQESEVVNPQIGFPTNIALWIKVSLTTLNKVRDLFFVIIIAILIASYFLGNIFLLINLALVVLMAFLEISPDAKNNIFSDIHTLILNVYKWNKVNHVECEKFCNLEHPIVLKNIYRVITEE